LFKQKNLILFVKQKGNFLLFIILISTLWACNPIKKLAYNEYLLNKNIIKTESIKISEQLSPIIKQKPNSKILGILRFHLIMYNLANKGKERKYKTWIKNTIGEEPVILDSALTAKSTKQLKLYMQKKGYFDAKVRDSIVLKNDKEVNIYYIINEGKPYVINSVVFESPDTSINTIMSADKVNSLIKIGDNFDVDVLEAERERITSELRNRGYFKFVKEYLHCNADSSIGKHKVDLSLKCDRVNEYDSIPTNHQIFKINDVFIQTDYNPLTPEVVPTDTSSTKEYLFLRSTPKRIFKHGVITQCLYLKPNDTYSLQNVDASYKRLGSLGVFRFVSIKFKEDENKKNTLDASILLTTLPRKSFSIETSGDFNGGNLGVGADLNISNKNIFGGAELLQLRVKGALEAQKTFVNDQNNNQKALYLFNTIEFGPELSLVIPRFMIPFKIRNLSNNSIPTTNITTAYNYQINPLYRRYITNLSLSYKWSETAHKKHILTPFEINAVKIDHDDSLVSRLKLVNDILLLSSYKSHLITATRYTYIFNNQDIGNKRKFVNYFTGTIEFAGNILRGVNSITNSLQSETGSYLIAGLPYAQYVKTELDHRIYHTINDRNKLVYRINIGFGLAYGNSQVLPFEKSFFAGGANDMRAWTIRQLGPGSYFNTERVDQIGDMKLEGNFEYRFDVLRLVSGPTFQGATFIDAGNIFTIKNDPVRNGAQFKGNTFYKNLAVGTGIGLRLNFTFFIIRVDWGIKLYDPTLVGDDRWVIKRSFNKSWQDDFYTNSNTNPAKKFSYSFTSLNFGIGYPF
jgi:outer membrane protein assembly factor BamA